MKVKNIYSANKKTICFPHMYVAEKDEKIIETSLGFIHVDKSKKVLYSDFFTEESFLNFDINNPKVTKDFKEGFEKIIERNKRDILFQDKKQIIQEKTDLAVLIGGCARSGTTLLQSIFSTNEFIECFEETFSFFPQPERIRYIESLINKSQKRIWCEKTPKNVTVFNNIQEILGFKKCKFIHIVRDCRDVITSIHPSRPNRYWVNIDRWINDVSCGLDNSPEQTLIVKYEDLTKSPRVCLSNISKFLDLPLDIEKCMSHEKLGFKGSDAWFQNPEKINIKSVGRWKKEPQKFKNILDEFYKNKKAISIMKKLGYEI